MGWLFGGRISKRREKKFADRLVKEVDSEVRGMELVFSDLKRAQEEILGKEYDAALRRIQFAYDRLIHINRALHIDQELLRYINHYIKQLYNAKSPYSQIKKPGRESDT